MNDKVVNVNLLKDGHSNRTIFILGSTGSGKTTLIANLLQGEGRFIIFDTRNEYSEDFFSPPAKSVSNLSEFISQLNDLTQRIIFKFTNNDDEQLEAALRFLYDFQKQNSELVDLPPVIISIDETNRFISTNNSPVTFREIIQRGRDYKIDKILGAQWFGTIPTWTRDSLSEIYVFRHNDPRGLALLEVFGFNKDEIRNLANYTCLHLSNSGIEKIKLKAVSKHESVII